ncbi:MAG: hypothetical protein CHACPFDD_01088 [Phycisphaerae bacterium]|nr:hypothetical protein [Phycisphaerae bacterium]
MSQMIGMAQIEIFYRKSDGSYQQQVVTTGLEDFAAGTEVLSGNFKLPAVSGRRDLAMSIAGSDNVFVMLNLGDTNSDGTTDWDTAVHEAKSSFGLAKGKLRSGTNIDLVVSNIDTQANRVLWGDNSEGDFGLQETVYDVDSGEDPYGIDTGKLNDGDTYLEIAVACAHGFSSGHGGLIIFVGNGDGTFDEPGYEFDVQPGGEPKPCFVKIDDIDQDGHDDVVTSNNNSHRISVLISDL